MLDKRLLEILVCPVTKGPLIYDKEAQELISKSAKLAYPIRDDIPIMLIDESIDYQVTVNPDHSLTNRATITYYYDRRRREACIREMD